MIAVYSSRASLKSLRLRVDLGELLGDDDGCKQAAKAKRRGQQSKRGTDPRLLQSSFSVGNILVG